MALLLLRQTLLQSECQLSFTCRLGVADALSCVPYVIPHFCPFNINPILFWCLPPVSTQPCTPGRPDSIPSPRNRPDWSKSNPIPLPNDWFKCMWYSSGQWGMKGSRQEVSRKKIPAPKKGPWGEETIFRLSLKIPGLCCDAWNHCSHLPTSLSM